MSPHRSTAAFGSWPSELSAPRIARGSLRLGQLQVCAGSVYWLERRPAEAGRQVVCRAPLHGGEPVEAIPGGVSARTRVHEYGGGEYRAHSSGLYFVDGDDHRIKRVRDGQCDEIDGCAPDAHYADLEVSPDGRWLVAVEERARSEHEPANRLVAFPLARGYPVAFAGDHDFVSFPRFSPDGARLAYTSWEHPNMPWDGGRLHEIGWGEAGPAGPARVVAGGDNESIFQPSYSPDGQLCFVSDRSGFWNLMEERDGQLRALCPREAEFGRPQWVFGMSTYAFVDDRSLVCAVREQGVDRLMQLNLESGALGDFELPFSEVEWVAAGDGAVALIAGSATEAAAVHVLQLSDGHRRCVRSSLEIELDPEGLSVAEPIEFTAADGATSHAFYYAPRSVDSQGPSDARPPLLVMNHGGPTSATSSTLDLGIQYWTQRGVAVVDVNYAGSTGYGRTYRERLNGQWGVLDVSDCVNAAQFLVEQGKADGGRTAIRGGSAGGFTTLCALTFHDFFRAGCSRYGIGDLEALLRETHKFEARYLDRLVGPYPEQRELYRERSPIHHVERLNCPVIFFQGDEDRVVPPNQAEAMVAALAARRVPHAFVLFAGEAHGFRRAESIIQALEGELYFYGQVLGFETDVAPAGLKIAR